MFGRLRTPASIGNRRKLGRVSNPPQDAILPHTLIRGN
jgi:hypothetical protein